LAHSPDRAAPARYCRVGRTGEWGGTVEEIKTGDVIWCPPKVKHWHGATPTTAMTHIALTGTVNGKNVEWMEPEDGKSVLLESTVLSRYQAITHFWMGTGLIIGAQGKGRFQVLLRVA